LLRYQLGRYQLYGTDLLGNVPRLLELDIYKIHIDQDLNLDQVHFM
jgi:hypothetical protein